MRRLLYIAYFFPPLGGAGVQRSLKFVRYLPGFGWSATVLTSRARYWMQDDSLLRELDPGTVILRAPFWGGRLAGGGESGGARSRARIGLLRVAARSVLLPDAYLGWVIPAAGLARRALSRETFDAILTTSSPDSTHLLGRHLKRRTGLPWVADFRDPWTRRLSHHPPTPLHARLHRALERSCLREADRVVVTTEETRRDFLDLHPDLAPAKFAVIPNGYDEEDFRAAARLLAGEPGRDLAQELPHAPILHAGQLNPERPIEPFLRGLKLFLQREPGRAAEVATLFLGGHYDRDRAAVRALGLEGTVRFQAGSPHLHSVAALLQARILLLLEQDSERGRLILPGKVPEYLRAGAPVLALVPREGAAARVIREMDAGLVVDATRPEAVAEALSRLLAATAAGTAGGARPAVNPGPAPGGAVAESDDTRPGPAGGDEPGTSGPRDSGLSSNKSLASYERRALTARLATLLDSLR